jgi:hypothetical protein
MRKPRQQSVARTKTNGRQGRARAKRRASHERTSATGSRGNGHLAATDPGRIAAPWNALARELYGFGSRRLNRVMRASSRCVAARSLDEVAEVQSQFVLELLNDYVDETGRVISACVQALEQNLDTFSSAGEAIGIAGSGPRAVMPMMRDPFIAARTATLVQ